MLELLVGYSVPIKKQHTPIFQSEGMTQKKINHRRYASTEEKMKKEKDGRYKYKVETTKTKTK